MLSYLVAFASASIWALLLTFPSLLVLMILSARRGATKSGLFVFCGMAASGLVPEWKIPCGCRRSPGASPGIFLVSVVSGDKQRLTTTPRPGYDIAATFSPDGRIVAFIR